jgi:hypothetical protein
MSAVDAGGRGLVHTPSPDDILLGWETRNEDHSGNLRLKELIKERAEEYISSDYQNAKVMIVRQVAEELTEDGGRFLCKSVDSGNAWVEAQRDYVLENIKQAFRETVSSMTSPRNKMSPPLTATSVLPAGLPATPYDSNSSERGPESTRRCSPPHLSLSSNSSMERSQRSLRMPSSITITPPAARLSPEGRIQHGLASTKETLLRRLAAQQQQQQLLQHSHRSLSSSSSSVSSSSPSSRLSPLDEATRRRKLHMAKMQAMLQQNRQHEHQLMTQLLGRSGAAGADAYATATGGHSLPARLAAVRGGAAGDHHSSALLSGSIPPRGGNSNLEALRAYQLPAQLRLTPLGTRRQLDPLAPNRKRKRGSAIV